MLKDHVSETYTHVKVDRSLLPNDVETLKDMVCECAAVIERQAAIIKDQAAQIATLTARVNQLEERYDKLVRLHFGHSSEKLSSLKTVPEVPLDPLSNNTSVEQATTDTTDAETSNTDTSHTEESISVSELKKKANKQGSRENHKGRNPFPSHLRREIIVYDLPANQKLCKVCGSFLSLIGSEEREQLESAIEKYIVLVYKRQKYACKNKNCGCQTIVTAPTPVEPIEKGCAGPNLLAEVIVDKYCDHLPLYRLQGRFARQGITLNRSTLWTWINQAAHLLESLVKSMIEDQMTSNHMFADETTIPTLWAHIPENKGKQAKINYFWVYTSLLNDNKEKPIVVYRFAAGRGSKYPMDFLKDFRGYLQVDAYSGYNPLFIPADVLDEAFARWCIEVACWTHARRYFVDAIKSNPQSIAKEVLLLIGNLYIYEADFKKAKLTFDQIKEQRQLLSKPKLDKIHAWLQHNQSLAAPKSLLGEAISYSLNNWQALNVYLTDGRLEIDNSRSERNMKGVAVGRKNYLFVASHRGGAAAATLYSIVETCRQNGVDAKAYLADILQRISTHPNSRIKELLPYHWKPPGDSSQTLKDVKKVA